MTDAMSSEPERAKAIFLDLADAMEAGVLAPDALEARLTSACGQDDALIARVRKLLFGLRAADAKLGRTVTPARALPEPRLFAPGQRVGPYVLAKKIGEGGFGTVWEAEQREPVQRRVALKILKPGLDTLEVVARFQAERQALAFMDHPNIAHVLGGGTTEHGLPYFAMELVSGAPITDFAERKRLDTRTRLELFLSVCRAVQHAHQKGVIHRDLKPNNVLVTEVDRRIQPKVIDFGIAKAAGARLNEETLVTREGQLVGTPAYMSPEQIAEAKDIDTRTDVYSLGVILYELLSGTRPFEEATAGQLLRVILEEEPARPSLRLANETTTTTRFVDSRKVKGDLDWIIMRCLEKDRERRYDSAAVLAEEIERHLAGRPIQAGPQELAYRARKFMGRHGGKLAAAGLVLASILVATFASVRSAVRALAAERDMRAQTELAREERDRSRTLAEFLEGVLAEVDVDFVADRDTELFELVLLRASRRTSQDKNVDPEVEAVVRRTLGHAYRAIGRIGQAELELRRAAELFERALGREHADTIAGWNDLAALASIER